MTTHVDLPAPRPAPRARPRPFVRLVQGVSHVVPSAKPKLQKSLIRLGYQVLNRRGAAVDAVCLNYGYAPAREVPADDDRGWQPHTDLSLLPDRHGLALYDRVASGAPLAGAAVLEVGCGRGGGAAYVARWFAPASLTGIDFSAQGIDWCRRKHVAPGLSFLRADAEALPFPDASFDAVLNVESSHCYPHMTAFVAEAARVLRPGGVMLMADLRPADHIDELRGQLGDRFTIEEDEDITADVVRALELDAPRRRDVIASDVPRLLRPAVSDFFAVPGSDVFGHLRDGGLEYRRFVLRKAAANDFH